MSNIVPTASNATAWRESHFTGRALAWLNSQIEIEIGIAEIKSEAKLRATRVTAVSYVGRRAMQRWSAIWSRS